MIIKMKYWIHVSVLLNPQHPSFHPHYALKINSRIFIHVMCPSMLYLILVKDLICLFLSQSKISIIADECVQILLTL